MKDENWEEKMFTLVCDSRPSPAFGARSPDMVEWVSDVRKVQNFTGVLERTVYLLPSLC